MHRMPLNVRRQLRWAPQDRGHCGFSKPAHLLVTLCTHAHHEQQHAPTSLCAVQPAAYEALQIKEPQRYFAHDAADTVQPASDAAAQPVPGEAHTSAADHTTPASDLIGPAAAKRIASAYSELLARGLGDTEHGAAASNGSAPLRPPVDGALAFDAAQEVAGSAQEQGSVDAHGQRRKPVTGAAACWTLRGPLLHTSVSAVRGRQLHAAYARLLLAERAALARGPLERHCRIAVVSC